ncbi:hypothetical protein IFR04_005048 [Cadophora malorum]|uniref:Pentatricopeptide repeat domain-containing protein n=1 Tax=Cadophora malorum TaxID=108018 RepID=A0A8H7WBB9_9HELO|nr:hypothetical protein IFR04_005048 [Cadophora malorum]
MQVLWSRAAQAKSSCSCRSCLHTATNVARRTTTAVGKRRVKVSDVFTACYSTILATAAVADMRVKEERRKEWDRVIAEAKAGTPTNDTKSGRFGAPEAAKLDTETTFLSKWKSTGQDEVHYKPMAVCGPASRHNSQLEVKLRKMGSRLEDEELSFVEEGPDLVLTAREPMKPMHLAKMQDMIARLAYKFLAESKIFTGQFLQGNSDVQLQTMQMKDRLQSLMEGFSNLPSYEWKDVDEVHDQRDALNRSLHTLCRNTKPNDRDAINLMLAKISYNMLVSTSPPSIVTYNVLLAEFTRLGEPHLAQIVVDSFMHDSKFKPSRTTVKLILDHYRSKKDPNGFRSIILRMRATRGKEPDVAPDMRIRKRKVKDLVKLSVQEWAMNTKTIHRAQALHEKTPRNAAIFDSVIRGCLEMKGVQLAVRQIRSAFREGHQVHQDTLCSVIRACVDQANFSVGVKLLRNILSLWEDGVGYMATVYTEDLRQLIHQLLVMCGFDTSLGSKNDLPIKASWDALQDLLYYMHLESISEAIGRCADLTASLSKSLGLTGPVDAVRPELQGTPKAQQTRDIDVALQMVVNYAAERQLRADHQRNLEIASRWLRLAALDFVMRTRQKRIQHVESELTAMLYCRLSDEKKARYDAAVSLLNSRPPSLAFVEKRHLLLRFRKPEQHLSKEVATAMEQSNLPTEMEPVQMKEVALRPYDAASSRPAIRLSARPHRSSFPMPMPLEAMRTKAELDVAAAS